MRLWTQWACQIVGEKVGGCDPCTLSYSVIALKLGFLAWCTIAVTVGAIMHLDHKDGF